MKRKYGKDSRKAIADSLMFLQIAGGKKYNPDYEGYRLDKRAIEDMPLTADEYERAAKAAAKLRGI